MTLLADLRALKAAIKRCGCSENIVSSRTAEHRPLIYSAIAVSV